MSKSTCTNHARSLVMTLAAVLMLNLAAFAQTSEFTYQGQLQSSSVPANGSFDFEFVLFDAGGSQVGPVLPRNGVSVVNGIFSVNLDFGSSFPGGTRFLEIRVRQAGGGAFTTLSPRQPVTSSPYSIKSLVADSAANATQLGGLPASQYLRTDGDGSGLANLNASNITSGTLANPRLGQIPTANIADAAVTAPKIAAGQVVKTLNGLTDNVTLAGSGNITVTPTGNTLTIASSAGSGVGGSGTSNTVPIWTGETTLGNSVITQSGPGNIGIGTTSAPARLRVVDLAGGNVAAVYGSSPVAGVRGDGTIAGVRGISTSGFGVEALSSSGAAVYGWGSNSGAIAVRGIGTSWFQGNTTPLTSANTGADAGVAIGSFANSGYIFAYNYFASVAKTLALNEPGGNVGIGTSTPAHKLGVVGGPSWTVNGWTGSVELNNASAIAWRPNSSGSSYGIGRTDGAMTFFRTTSAPGTTGSGAIYNLVITDNDLVGIGTLTPDATLSVNGGATKPGGGSWGSFSDDRLKNIKGGFTPGLNAVMGLKPLRYEYKKENALDLKSEGEHVGFSAQEVEKLIPEAVTKNSRGYRIVNNDPIMWTMLNAIKEQQGMIEKLTRQVRQLQRANTRKKAGSRR